VKETFCIGIVSLFDLLAFAQEHFRFELSEWEFLAGLGLVLLVAGASAPRATRRLAAAIDSGFRVAARRRWHAALVSGMLPLAIGLLMIWRQEGFPIPSVHDEFSYLLAAETFASGRLANPAFPIWVPFETFHVNSQPFYVSMYPPGQGLLLALGIVLFGHPWFGVLLSVTALGTLTFWALEAWLPRRWALAGALGTGVIAGLSYWMTSYWGGALAACGGALVTGAMGRLASRPVARYGVLFGVGLVILANTRMYEGAVLALACGGGLILDFRRLNWVAIRRRVIPAAAAVTALGGAWMLYYSWKTTGSPFELPYVQNLKTYHSRRLFVFQEDGTNLNYNHEVMRRLYRDEFRLDRSDPRLLPELASDTVRHFGGSLLLVSLLMLPWLLRDRRIRPLLLVGVTAAFFGLLPVWIRPHYLAPAMAAWIGITIQALRHLQAIRWRRWRPALFPARVMLASWIVLAFVRKAVAFTLIGLDGAGGAGGANDSASLMSRITVANVPEWAVRRDQIERSLSAQGGRHLVLVRYSPRHNVHQEWVYNHANWNESPVLWAREMDRSCNRQLAESMPDRTIWILEADAQPEPVLKQFRETPGDGGAATTTTSKVTRLVP